MSSVHCIHLSVISFSIAFVLIVLFVYIVHCKVGLKEEWLVANYVTH